ncbi:cofilin-2-like [Seriola lalandi dorsalis]|uniref:Cofilin-2-like n=1 Tax=Seriola lalandi dorsalis TaxID=1841481 RepID=A0A3B4WDY5_SERLL|nr:cofilin-2-like [Seriola lalandi dorsalis]XP_056251304.1 non-muscle cofilin 1-like [Seriola aureovittata]
MSQPALLPYDPLSILTAAAIFSLLPAPSQITSKMASGVKVADQVKDLYNEMKVVKNDADQMDRIRLVVFKIGNGLIDMEKIFRQKEMEDTDVFKFFVGLLKPDECRYMLYDCHFETKESLKKEELVFVMWAPENAPVKEKMNYASSKESMRKILTGIKHQLQVNDLADLSNRDSFAAEMGKDIVTLEGHAVQPASKSKSS